MNNLSRRDDSYHIPFYDILITTTKDLLTYADVTSVALSIVLLIVVIVSSLMYLFERNADDIFTYPEEIFSMSPDEQTGINSITETPKGLNYKQLLVELHHAASKCYDDQYATKCIRLMKYCPYLINVSAGTSGMTPFQRVCYNGHTSLAQHMLTKGANPCLTTESGENALCLAVYYYLKHPKIDDFPCLDLLNRSGCYIDSHSQWFTLALRMATRIRHKRLTEWLIASQSHRQKNYLRSSSLPPTITVSNQPLCHSKHAN